MSGSLIMVIAAPSGAGKSSLVNALLGRDVDGNDVVSISLHLAGDAHRVKQKGRDYHFVSARKVCRDA